MRTQRSTSGVVSLLVGNNTRFMLGASSRRQTAVSHSTPEAEIVAADAGLRTEALPALPLWEILLKREVRAEFKEDNEAVIKICRSGGSQKLMHMNKTHRVDAAFIAEQFGKDKPCDLTDTHTADQAADICTKRFEEARKWLMLLTLVNVLLPAFWKAKTYGDYLQTLFDEGYPSRTGGSPQPKVAPGGVKIEKKKLKKKRLLKGKGKQIAEATQTAVAGERQSQDYWVEDDVSEPEQKFRSWTRVHAKKRLALFTPTGSNHTAGGKVYRLNPEEQWSKQRITNVLYEDGKTETIVDDWSNEAMAHRCLEKPWTGTTRFYEIPDDVCPAESQSDKVPSEGQLAAMKQYAYETDGTLVRFDKDAEEFKRFPNEHDPRWARAQSRTTIDLDADMVIAHEEFWDRKNRAPAPQWPGGKRNIETMIHYKVDDVAPAVAPTGLSTHNRMIMEYCCSANSLLGRHTDASATCCRKRYTETEDMRKTSGLKIALSDSRHWRGNGNVLLWSSIPCTGGSPWQYVNEARHLRTGDKEALEKLENLRSEFALFWKNFEVLAEEVIRRKGFVAIEWPSACSYWKDPRVRMFLLKHGFTKIQIHGCAYGLRAPCGTPIKKPCFSRNILTLGSFQ